MIKDIFRVLTTTEKSNFIRLIIWDVLVSILDILFLVALLAIVNFYTKPEAISSSASFLKKMLIEYPLFLIVSYFLLFILKNVFAFYITRKQYEFVYKVSARCSNDRLNSYMNSSYSDYVHIDSSVITRSVNQQPIEFAHYVLRGFHQVVSQAILIIFTITAILIYNGFVFALLLSILLPPILLIGWIIKSRMANARSTVKQTSERSMQYLNEALAGYIESNIYGKTDFFTHRYRRQQQKLNKFLAAQQVIQNLPSRFMEIFAVFGLVLLLAIYFYSTSSGTIDVIIIGAFIAAAYKIIPGIVKILNGIGQMKTFEFTIKDLLPKQESVSSNYRSDDANLPLDLFKIELQSVSFGFEQKQVIREFSTEISSGDFLVIKGRSGSGKTTLINLMLGLLLPDKGLVVINGKPGTYSLRTFWNRVSYVKQQPFLLHDTITKNITLEEDNYNDERLKKVMSICGIEKMGIEAEKFMITENGKNISGGQRQRILFGRALYKEHQLLILDEPFNELDEEAELNFLKHLQSHSASGNMVVLITHSPKAELYSNKIILLDE